MLDQCFVYIDSSLTFCVDICLESDLSPPLVSGRCMMPMHPCHGGDLIAKTNTINIEMRKNCYTGERIKIFVFGWKEISSSTFYHATKYNVMEWNEE